MRLALICAAYPAYCMASVLTPRSMRAERTYERHASAASPIVTIRKGMRIEETWSGRSPDRGLAFHFARKARTMICHRCGDVAAEVAGIPWASARCCATILSICAFVYG